MKFTFCSQMALGSKLPDFPQEVIKNEPMFFRASLNFALANGGRLTGEFLDNLPCRWWKDGNVVIDSRVHMLMKGWYPAIPGWHHDDVPRSRSDGQPNYQNPEYHSEHAMALFNGDICPTDFAIGTTEFEDVPLGQKYYEQWHPVVEEKIKSGKLTKVQAPSSRVIFFNWQTWHQGTAAIEKGWRFFIRATRNSHLKPKNEMRRQVQVYMDKVAAGW